MGEKLSKRGIDRVRDVLAGYVDDGSHPGLVWMVARPGEVHVDALGVATLGDTTPMARDAIFRISSMTKPVTAVAAMMLVEDGKLRLDDPIDEWIPELADRPVLRSLDSAVDDTVPAHRPITVRDLLTFRMGHGMVLAEPGSLPILRALDEVGLGAGPPEPGDAADGDTFLARLGSLPLVHQPGEVWMYHTGLDVMGQLIARVTGGSFGAFLAERVFGPLGMTDTGFFVPAPALHRLATSYVAEPGTGTLRVFDPAVGGQWSAPPAFEGGGAGLVSTVDDFHAFSVMLASAGLYQGERLLARPTVDLMMTDHITAAQKAASPGFGDFWSANGWGLGLSMVTKRVDVSMVPGRIGWDGGLGTAWTVDRGEQIVTILMTQRVWDSPEPPAIVRDFRNAAYAAIAD